MTPVTKMPHPPIASFPRTLWIYYLVALAEHPILTKSGTAATLNALQELAASSISPSPSANTTHDRALAYRKAAAMAAYGGLVAGPLGHVLYKWMEKVFHNRTGTGAAVGKLLFGNLVIAPIQSAVYLAAMAGIAGAGVRGVVGTVRGRLVSVLKLTWIVFPAVQIFALKYVRQELWMPFFNLVGFVFGTYINVTTKLAARRKALKKE
ncbi:uncharacterized protein EV422DRAFT_539061 [Fimicolochytrium jonesii]|uniref:uncharacterized protein n=1 Tax=Fimicolochytrium jonesii TaxID=1396493 RepID=UPI0022FEA2EC|nr:uncharacterized protein EV422DRAFT_539061 [Fimicolochytrium jonesii]KAI8818210.1 hypothetical protein EV422DRAFT_539061 [Fimicolochytrium jonesii]